MSTNPDLERVVTAVARAASAHVAIGLIASGVQLFMVAYCLVVYSQSPPAVRKGRAMYMVVTIVLFLLSTAGSILIHARYFTIQFEATSVVDYIRRISTQLVVLAHLNNEMSYACVLIGDALMMYRCYIIWADRLWVLITPGLTFLGTVSCCILLVVREIRDFQGDNKPYVIPFYSLSVSFNVLVTLLIAGRLIYAQRRLSNLLGVHASKGGKKLAHITGASAVLIESAVPLSVVGLAMISMYSLEPEMGSPGYLGKVTATLILLILYPIFIVLSPQLIIFRVTTGRSWVAGIHKTLTQGPEDGGRDDPSGGGLSHDLVFARSRGMISSDASQEDDSEFVSSSEGPKSGGHGAEVAASEKV